MKTRTKDQYVAPLSKNKDESWEGAQVVTVVINKVAAPRWEQESEVEASGKDRDGRLFSIDIPSGI